MNVNRTVNLSGMIFGTWNVIEFYGYDKHHEALWLCRCGCGVEKPVKAAYLLRGTSKKCKTCARPVRKPLTTLPHSFWTNVQRNAKKRNIPMEISKEQCYDLLIKQKYRCALSGLEIYMSLNESEHMEGSTTASIDRIDSAKGYYLDNIQWIHKDVNYMKHTFDQQYFLDICEKIVMVSRGGPPE